jgi:hypothetical protein
LDEQPSPSQLRYNGGRVKRVKYPNPSERTEAMYELYASGRSLAEVGAVFGVSETRVGQVFRAHGLMVPPPDKLPSQLRQRQAAEREARARAMHELYASGATLDQVGHAFGVTGTYVRQLFEAVGLSTRGPGGLTRTSFGQPDATTRRDYRKGMRQTSA